MTKVQITMNGRAILARVGSTVLDAALAGRVAIPHGCSTGTCDTCRVTVQSGVDDQGTRQGDTVLACRATVVGEAAISFEDAPAVVTRAGVVSGIRALSPGISEVVVDLDSPLRYLPGQHVKLGFKGLPERDYVPTIGLGGEADQSRLYFHVRRYPEGRFSSAVGDSLREGVALRVRGPFGHCWLRQGTGPLVLVSSGAGFAPIWSIAVAARLGQPDRPLTVIAAARDPADLYMRQAFSWLAARGTRDLTLTTSGGPAFADIRLGRPTDALPDLTPDHTIHVAGAPAMVEAVKERAALAGATCYADPFVVTATPRTLTERLWELFGRSSADAPLGEQPLRPEAT